MTAPHLVPCPFCGGKNLRQYDNFIYCQDCQAQGPWSTGIPIVAWNRRAPLAVNAELLAALRTIQLCADARRQSISSSDGPEWQLIFAQADAAIAAAQVSA